jgi:hypothetical protein
MIRVDHDGILWRANLVMPLPGQPAREVVTGRRKRVTGTSTSRKSAACRDIVWESGIERSFITLQEFDERTTFIVAQPHTIRVWNDEEQFSYTPDFLLGRNGVDGLPEIVEIKPRLPSSDSDSSLMHSILAVCYDALGYSFSIRVQVDTHSQPRLRNCQLLLRWQHAAVRPNLTYLVTTLFLASKDTLTLGACVAEIDNLPNTRFELYALACRGNLQLDLSVPLGPTTRILNAYLPEKSKQRWGDSYL